MADDSVAASDVEEEAFVGYERVEFVEGFLRVVVEDVGGGEFIEEFALVCVCGWLFYVGSSVFGLFSDDIISTVGAQIRLACSLKSVVPDIVTE